MLFKVRATVEYFIHLIPYALQTDIDSVVRRRSSYSISATSPKGGSASKVRKLIKVNLG